MTGFRLRAVVSASLLAMAFHGSANAQTASPEEGTAETAPPSGGDIVVTAQRRAERLEDVPIAVAAVSTERIETMGIISAKDVQLLAPGLNFETSYGYAQPYIRGIGSQSPTPGIEASTAIYIDGIYQPHAAGSLTDIFDMAGVQILRGAQGTLYGRNASGGAILYSYAEPVLGKSSLKMTAEYGNRDHALISAVANAPLSDTIAIRLAGQITHYGGYLRNIVDGRDWGGRTSYNVRGKVKWEVTPDLTADLTVEQFHSDDANATQAVRGPKEYCLACNLPIPGADLNPTEGYFDIATNSHQSSWDYDFFRASLKLTYAVDDFTINSQSYYFNNRARVFSNQGNAATFSFFDYDPDQGGKVYGQDLSLVTSFGGAFDFMVGGSYSHADDYNHTTFNGLAFGGLTDLRTENFVPTTSTAGFAELYVRPIDRVTITLGGRYTHDNRKLRGVRSPSALLAYDPGADPEFRQETSSNIFTGRAVVNLDLDDFHVYGGWTSGYKAGGFSTVALRPTTIITPERIDNYESGIKYVSPGRDFRANLALFYYKYRNAQVTITDLSAGGDLPPAEWPRDYDSLDHERDIECRARSTSRKRSSASCVKLRLCWRRERARLKPVAGSRSASRPIIGGARSMAA
ncbi:hypothetical protein LH19_26455 (plasmid) [Sphingopyxis macrogoltabida]|nr:hypothetical protein LH19_26455 [Sphingopyxis macrogoltabida]